MIEKSFINSQLGIKFNSYIYQKCRVWFKAKDVAKILGYCDTKKAIKQHVSVENKIKHPPNKKTLEENIACLLMSLDFMN